MRKRPCRIVLIALGIDVRSVLRHGIPLAELLLHTRRVDDPSSPVLPQHTKHRLEVPVDVLGRHCLIGWPGAALSDLTLVMSHPQALAQCEHTLTRLGLQREVVYDTAGAVKMLKASAPSCR